MAVRHGGRAAPAVRNSQRATAGRRPSGSGRGILHAAGHSGRAVPPHIGVCSSRHACWIQGRYLPMIRCPLTIHYVQCCGSGFKSPVWIRIRIRDPDPASEFEAWKSTFSANFSWFSLIFKMIPYKFPCVMKYLIFWLKTKISPKILLLPLKNVSFAGIRIRIAKKFQNPDPYKTIPDLQHW